jgi:precorrin-3B C17-methyltransferase
MNTTVTIGNSSTFTFGDMMITPRGYRQKYDLDTDNG